MASWFASVTSEEIIQITFWGVDYLTVLVYTETSIHLSVGGYLPRREATDTEVNSC